MFCIKCGKEIPEGTNFCPGCGERTEKKVNFDNVKAYTSQKVQETSANVQGIYQKFKEAREKEDETGKVDNTREEFVREDERQIAEIKSGYLRNFFSGGGLSKAQGIVTDRRLYYRGKSYYRLGGRYLKSEEDRTVDIQDITSSGFVYTKRLWALILAIFCLIVPLIVMVIFQPGENRINDGYISFFIFVSFLMFFPFMTIYFFFKVTIYSITFAGDVLGVNASFFDIEILREFDKNLHRAKDARLSEDQDKLTKL